MSTALLGYDKNVTYTLPVDFWSAVNCSAVEGSGIENGFIILTVVATVVVGVVVTPANISHISIKNEDLNIHKCMYITTYISTTTVHVEIFQVHKFLWYASYLQKLIYNN